MEGENCCFLQHKKSYNFVIRFNVLGWFALFIHRCFVLFCFFAVYLLDFLLQLRYPSTSIHIHVF